MNVIMLVLGIAATIFYCAVYFRNADKYDQMVQAADEEIITFRELLPVGLALVQKLNIKTADTSIKKRQKFAELYTSQYTDYYCLISRAAAVSYFVTFLPLGLLLGALMNSVLVPILVLLLTAFMPYYTTMRMDSMIKNRREELLLDYPTVLSKMALMINAGMMLSEAWRTVASSGSRILYREMQRTIVNINNGMPEIQAYSEFGMECRINELKKFSSIICQNVEKGNSEIVQVMKQLSIEAWAAKKNIAISRGKNAETKLIIPIGITFLAIIIMIMVPIMSNMSF